MPVMCIRFTDRLVRLDQRHCAAAVPPVSGFRYTVLNLFGCLTRHSLDLSSLTSLNTTRGVRCIHAAGIQPCALLH